MFSQSCYRFEKQELSFLTNLFRDRQEFNLVVAHFIVEGTVEMDNEETDSLAMDNTRRALCHVIFHLRELMVSMQKLTTLTKL